VKRCNPLRSYKSKRAWREYKDVYDAEQVKYDALIAQRKENLKKWLASPEGKKARQASQARKSKKTKKAASQNEQDAEASD
jgi:predicted aminopeptidase